MKKSKLRKLIREAIRKILDEQGNPNSPVVNWTGNYQYHLCAAGNPSTTNTQANGYTCPNARLVRAKNCDTSDTQNYYLVTEVNGSVPQVNQTYCGAPNANLNAVNGPCVGVTLKIVEVFGSGVNEGDIVYPKTDQGGCPAGTNTGGKPMCSDLTTPIAFNFTANVQTMQQQLGGAWFDGWSFVFDCLLNAVQNPCATIREKMRRWNSKLPSVGPAQADKINQRINHAMNVGNNVHGCNNLQNLSPNAPDTLTFGTGGGATFNLPNWTSTFTNQANNAQNTCNFLQNRINAFNTQLASAQSAVGPGGGVGWRVQQIDMLNSKITVAQDLQAQNNC